MKKTIFYFSRQFIILFNKFVILANVGRSPTLLGVRVVLVLFFCLHCIVVLTCIRTIRLLENLGTCTPCEFLVGNVFSLLYDWTVYVWVTLRVSYQKQELFTLREHAGSPSICGGIRVAHRFSFLCCVFYFPCFRPVSCVPNVVSVSGFIVYSWLPLVLFVFVLYLVYPMLPVSLALLSILDCPLFCLFSSCILCTQCCQCLWLYCPFLIAPSVFSNVYSMKW
jgi:hypothetical protein